MKRNAILSREQTGTPNSISSISKMSKYRKFVTTGVGFTFLVVGITGVIFRFFFKNHALEEIHGWIGVAMFAAVLVHIVQNWRPLYNHLRDWRVFTLLIPLVLVIACLGYVPQASHSDPGVNPREIVNRLLHAKAGHLATAFNKNINSVLTLMKNDGLQVDSTDETIEQLALENQRSPEGILSYFIK